MIKGKETEIRALARDSYNKLRIDRPHMPHPDSDEGQRKIDRLFDIMSRFDIITPSRASPVSNGRS